MASRGKHSRGYLDNLHRRERCRNIIWGSILGAAIVVGIIVIAASALPQQHSSTTPAEQPEQMETTTSSPASTGTATESASAQSGIGSNDGKQEDADKPLDGITICIDPGHCANPDATPSPNNPDSSASVDIATEPGGTSGRISGPEYKICLLVAKQLKKDYESAGAKVVMVRTKNDIQPISPKNRALIANKAHADAFVRLHCDSAGNSAHGFYTLVPAKTGYQAKGGLYRKSQKMGRFMHERIVKSLGASDRGITIRSDQGGFNWCKEPCVLFEMANMANASDDRKLATRSYRKKLAKAICSATVDWFER